MEGFLDSQARADLLRRHRLERDGRIKDRMKVILLRDDGWSYACIAEALFLSEEGVRQHFKDYIDSEGTKIKPENGGSESFLDALQTQELLEHLQARLYIKASNIRAYVHQTYGVFYTVSGMRNWLKQHGFSFHQPCGVPAKANALAQEGFVETYKDLKRTLPDEDHIVFMDGVHPTHAVRFTKGWIKKGVRKEIPTNGSHKRLNILGALNLAEMALHSQEYDTINGTSITSFLAHLLTVMPRGNIHVILDQARYNTCKEVKAWVLLNPRIHLHHLPPYSPNLNSIEPCWKILHEHTTNNIYHPTFNAFTEKIRDFLHHTFPKNARSWTDRLTDNFSIIGKIT